MQDIFVAYCEFGATRTIKVVYDRDCIPSDVSKLATFTSTADMKIRGDRSERFWHYYEKMKWLENLNFFICIDFGDYFYETGMPSPMIFEEGSKAV